MLLVCYYLQRVANKLKISFSLRCMVHIKQLDYVRFCRCPWERFFLEGLQKKQSLFLLGVKHEVFDILSVIPVNKAVGSDSLSHKIPKSCQETI